MYDTVSLYHQLKIVVQKYGQTNAIFSITVWRGIMMYLASNTNNTCLTKVLSKSPEGSVWYSALD